MPIAMVSWMSKPCPLKVHFSSLQPSLRPSTPLLILDQQVKSNLLNQESENRNGAAYDPTKSRVDRSLKSLSKGSDEETGEEEASARR